MRYAIYNSDGTILRVLSCPEKCLQDNVRSGEFACELPTGDDSSHEIVNGQPVRKQAADEASI